MSSYVPKREGFNPDAELECIKRHIAIYGNTVCSDDLVGFYGFDGIVKEMDERYSMKVKAYYSKTHTDLPLIVEVIETSERRM